MAETIIVERRGNAETRRAAVDGVAVPWGNGNASPPKKLPAGTHYLYYFAKRTPGRTWGFRVRVIDPDTGQTIRIVCNNSGTLPASGTVSGECPFAIQ